MLTDSGLMVAAGFHSFENGTFVTGDGTDVMNDEQFAVDPGAAFAARYFLQRDYIDNVADYSGSMTAALDAARDDLMGQIASGQASGELFEQLELVDRLTDFGEQYDITIHGRREGSFGVQGLLNHSAAAAMDQDAIAAALNEVAQDRSRTDSHPMYQHILDGTFAPLLDPDGFAGPTVGSDSLVLADTYITARTLYNDGKRQNKPTSARGERSSYFSAVGSAAVSVASSSRLGSSSSQPSASWMCGAFLNT